MEKFDVAVIGAGLGGLQCAYILAKRGLKVVVLEKNRQYLGGCLQSFRRKGKSFDTGFHYIGGLDEGQPLNTLFRKFGLMELPWVKMDEDCFDEVVFGGKSYKIPQGFDRFKSQMKDYFPQSAADIDKYADLLKDVAQNLLKTFGDNMGNISEHPYFVRKASDFLAETISDTTLRNVLSGTSPKLNLHANLPLYVFAQINASFINSAYRLRTDGMAIADHLAADIESFGGVILKGANVTSVADGENGTKILSVEGMESIEAGKVVSNVHPALLSSMLPESQSKKLNRRLKHTSNSFGMFTVNVSLKPGRVKYLNRNIYIHNTDNVWTEGDNTSGENPPCALISFRCPADGEFCDIIDILTPMQWSDVEKFDNGTSPMNRGKDYEDFKKAKAQQLIDLASGYVDGFGIDAIEDLYTSTPLTYRDYIGSELGSAFGINKDSDKLLYTMPSPIVSPGIYQCGQNCGLHGVLGVTMTACIASMAILGENSILGVFGD